MPLNCVTPHADENIFYNCTVLYYYQHHIIITAEKVMTENKNDNYSRQPLTSHKMKSNNFKMCSLHIFHVSLKRS